MRSNELCELLGIRYPIIEGGMAYIGDGNLAAAVSNAGCLGMIAASRLTPDRLRSEIRSARSQTSFPLGVNIPLGHASNAEEILNAALDEGIKVISLSAGNPVPFIMPLREKGCVVIVLVGTVRHAVSAQRAGAHILVVEGFEAGGHNSPAELTTMAAVPQVVDAVDIPVVAAGGIMDGRGMAAALALGASGVQLGSRFVATLESPASDAYKQALVEAGDESTVVLERNIGRAMRVLRGTYTSHVLEQQDTGALSLEDYLDLVSGERNRAAALSGQMDKGYAYGGQGVGLILDVPPVVEVVERLVQQYRAVLQSLPQIG